MDRRSCLLAPRQTVPVRMFNTSERRKRENEDERKESLTSSKKDVRGDLLLSYSTG